MDADPIWRETTGNIVFPGFTAPKLAWVKAQEQRLAGRPHLAAQGAGQVRRVLPDQPGVIFADFGGAQHELSFEGSWPAFVSVRCSDGEVVKGAVLLE